MTNQITPKGDVVKVWCDSCEGRGNNDMLHERRIECPDCQGLGYKLQEQPEQLEVEIKEWHDPVNVANYHIIFMNSSIRDKVFLKTRTKQQALDWCAKYNLKVKTND